MRSTTEYREYISPECEVVEVELERGVLQGSGGGISSSRTEGVTEEEYNM